MFKIEQQKPKQHANEHPCHGQVVRSNVPRPPGFYEIKHQAIFLLVGGFQQYF